MTGKTTYRNRQTGMEVVYDNTGEYFRIFDPATGRYFDAAGGSLDGLPGGVAKARSHFKAKDS